MMSFANNAGAPRQSTSTAAKPWRRDSSVGGARMLDVLSLMPEEPTPDTWFGELGPITIAELPAPVDPYTLLDRLSLTRRS